VISNLLCPRHAWLAAALLLGNLATGTNETKAEQTDWHVGLARAKITPTQPIRMAGYASRDKPSEGVLADLFAKAMAIEDGRGNRAVLLTADVIGFRAKVADYICERIMAATSLKRSQILLAPSHTHTGPVIGIDGATAYGLQGQDAQRVHEYCDMLTDKLLAVTMKALSDLQPAKISWGLGVTDIVMNRREFTERGVRLGFNPRGYVDRSVPVLRVDDAEGKCRLLLFGCACHNTTLTGQHYRISGDYAGFAQEHIEAELPGVQAMFLIGCAGSANPYPRGTVEAAKENGNRLGAEVCRVASRKLQSVGGPLQIGWKPMVLPLEPVPPREELQAMVEGPSYLAYNARQMLTALDKGDSLASEFTTPLAIWQFGKDLTLVALPGEVVNGYVPLLEKALGPRKLWISAYANDCFGYLPTAQVLAEGGYETRCLYSQPGFFPPEVEGVVVQAVGQLATEVGRPIAGQP